MHFRQWDSVCWSRLRPHHLLLKGLGAPRTKRRLRTNRYFLTGSTIPPRADTVINYMKRLWNIFPSVAESPHSERRAPHAGLGRGPKPSRNQHKGMISWRSSRL